MRAQNGECAGGLPGDVGDDGELLPGVIELRHRDIVAVGRELQSSVRNGVLVR